MAVILRTKISPKNYILGSIKLFGFDNKSLDRVNHEQT